MKHMSQIGPHVTAIRYFTMVQCTTVAQHVTIPLHVTFALRCNYGTVQLLYSCVVYKEAAAYCDDTACHNVAVMLDIKC